MVPFGSELYLLHFISPQILAVLDIVAECYCGGVVVNSSLKVFCYNL